MTERSTASRSIALLQRAKRNAFTLRFVDASLEGEFAKGRVVADLPFVRVACVISLLNWSLGAFLVSRTTLPAAHLTIMLALSLMVPASVLGLALTWRLKTLASQQAIGATLNGAAGLCFLVVTQPSFEQYAPLLIAADIVFVLVLRQRFVTALVTSAPYVFGYAAIDVYRFPFDQTSVPLMTVATTWLLCMIAAYLAEKSSREIFLQRLIIEEQQRELEAQKETIAEERAKTERLLKQEVGHQVAERSRDLGEALARIDTAIVVAAPAVGDRFHTRYRILRALGAGGMGAVFEVERLTDSQRLALKVVTGQVSGTSAARFAREAEIGAKIHHRHLVSIVDVGIADGGAPFLVMELVTGGSLEDHRSRFGSTAWARPILRQIAEGLHALHEARVVHRDLKPANVLLSGDEDAPLAKISDFGISRFSEIDGVVDAERSTILEKKVRALTGTGAILGTPFYMAPEAAKGGRAVDAAADVFAFGILAYEMLTARAPFAMPPILLAMTGQLLPTPTRDGLPEDLAEIILRCVSLDPALRPSPAALREALSTAIRARDPA